MAVQRKPSDQEPPGRARAGRVARDDGDEHAGAAHPGVLVAVAASGSAIRRARPTRRTR